MLAYIVMECFTNNNPQQALKKKQKKQVLQFNDSLIFKSMPQQLTYLLVTNTPICKLSKEQKMLLFVLITLGKRVLACT